MYKRQPHIYLKVNEKGIINFNGISTVDFITNNGRINIYNKLDYRKKILQNVQLYIHSGHLRNVTKSNSMIINTGEIYNYAEVEHLYYYGTALLENSGGTIYNYPNASINFREVNTKDKLLIAFTNKNGIINNSGFIQNNNKLASNIKTNCDICGTVFTVREPFDADDNIYNIVSNAYNLSLIHI